MDDMAAGYYHSPPDAAHNPYHPPPPIHATAPPGAPPPPHNHPMPPHQLHFHPPYPAHQPPLYGATYDTPTDQYSRDEVRTLFIAGLPDDVKPREIYNLFREFPGYQSAQLRSSGQSSQAYAFAVFTDQQSALAAMHALNGLMFDLERESTLYIDLAKSNSRSKRSRTDDGAPYSSDKRVRGSGAYLRGFPDSGNTTHSLHLTLHMFGTFFTLAGSGSNIHMSGMVNSAYSLSGYPSTQRLWHMTLSTDLLLISMNMLDSLLILYIPSSSLEYKRLKRVSKCNLQFYSFTWGSNKTLSQNNSSTYAPQSNPPCPTLFVANLGPNCSEQELAQVFSRCPGFIKLKMQNKNGLPVAFVDFQDVNSSTGALNHLQGTILYSSVGEGMRLEYAKSRMGLRKREKRT
ncbi:unnamed protein product [Musa textilis]